MEASAPPAINWLAAVWVPLVAAIVGGALSALGAVSAIGWQIRESQRSADKAAVDLCSFLLSEQIRLLTNLEQYRSSQAGQVSFIDADKLQANYNVFERNKEWLVRVRVEAARSAVSDSMSAVQVWATVTRGLANQQQAAIAQAAIASPNSPELAQAEAEAQARLRDINTIFADLPRIRSDCVTALSRLTQR